MSGDSSQVRYAFPKYKVFIYGVEVSDDVVSINTNAHDGNSPNTCHITLLNEQDKYIITTQDMMALNPYASDIESLSIPWMNEDPASNSSGTPGVASSPLTGSILGDYIKDRLNAGTILSPRKAKIIARKNSVANQTLDDNRVGPTGEQLGKGFTNYYGQSVVSYPMSDGSPVFHPMDPVRVFMRDPYDPSRWYHHFTGFVSDMVENTDQNNAKLFTVVVEDPTKLFRYTRFFINPGIVDANVAVTSSDIRVSSFYSNFLHGFSLPEALFTLLFGPDKVGAEILVQGKEGAGGKTNIATKLRGVGHFSFKNSAICSIGPEPSDSGDLQSKTVNNDAEDINFAAERTPKTKLFNTKHPEKLSGLSAWQAIIDHEAQPSDLWTMLDDTLKEQTDAHAVVANISTDEDPAYEADGKLDIEKVITYIGEHPEKYLVDGGRLMVLIPNSLGIDNNRVIIEDILQSYPMQSEWTTFGQIMYELTSRIQFVMYCTPKGDLVIEPPLFDFDPDDFGVGPISSGKFLGLLPVNSDTMSPSSGSFVELQNAESAIPSRSRGPFDKSYRILKRDTTSWESAFVDEKVHTMATVSRNIVQNWDSVGQTSIIGDLAVAKIPDLVPLYGVRCIPITAKGYVSSREGAFLYGQIELNKLNADAHTVKVNHMPNIQLGLNRPIYVQGRNFIGTTKQISHSITWGEGGDMSTTTDLYSVRTWNGQVDRENHNQPIYTTIGGYASRPLNYAVLFKKASTPSKTKVTNNGTNKSNSSAQVSDKSSKANKSIKDSKDAQNNAKKVTTKK